VGVLNSVFTLTREIEEFEHQVEDFVASERGPVPVWVGARDDLIDSAVRAADVYEEARRPLPVAMGTRVETDLPPGILRLLDPLAETWMSTEQLAATVREGPVDALIVGTYSNLRSSELASLLAATPNASVSFLTGRDLHSLAWLVAKQWVTPARTLNNSAFVSSAARAPRGADIIAFGERELEATDIQGELLSRVWRSVLVQGHGKDDSVNLGKFTICGLNPSVPQQSGALRPRCGYGWPCYKDPEKLIPVRELRVAELLLSACNSGPLSDLALYDPKYVLLLSAIDGCAQSITAAVGVHDSSEPENDLWAGQISAGERLSHDALNENLQSRHPQPGFWHFGLPAPRHPKTEILPPPPEVTASIARAHSLVATDLLPPQNQLRVRLTKFSHKANRYLARDSRHRDQSAGGVLLAQLRSDLQSIDFAIAERTITDSEWGLLDFGSYFGARSSVAQDSIHTVECACGNPATAFERRSPLATIPTTECVFCLRCGDVDFRLAGAPLLRAIAPERIRVTDPLAVECVIRPREDGPLQVGIFAPSYLREQVAIQRPRQRLRAKRGAKAQVNFTLEFSPEVPAQAYYFTVFAVQNLGVSTHRRHLGIEGLRES
jgi:hypothetical protein